MARIRTVKPDFFRHEELQDLEKKHPCHYVMLVFEGLWTLCDNKGRFKYQPRTIKLDVLPFLDFDMAATLQILEDAEFIFRYEVAGEKYGCVPTFNEHQRLNTKEQKEGERYPEPPKEKTGDATGPHPGHNGDATGITGKEGKGKEEEKEGKGYPSSEENKSSGFTIEKIREEFSNSFTWLEKLQKDFKMPRDKLDEWLEKFISNIDGREKYHEYEKIQDAKDHCYNWITDKLKKENGKKSPTASGNVVIENGRSFGDWGNPAKPTT